MRRVGVTGKLRYQSGRFIDPSEHSLRFVHTEEHKDRHRHRHDVTQYVAGIQHPLDDNRSGVEFDNFRNGRIVQQQITVNRGGEDNRCHIYNLEQRAVTFVCTCHHGVQSQRLQDERNLMEGVKFYPLAETIGHVSLRMG